MGRREPTWKYLCYAAGTSEGRREGGVVADQSSPGFLAPIPEDQLLIPRLQVGQKQSEVLGDGRIDSKHVTTFHHHGDSSAVAPTKRTQ